MPEIVITKNWKDGTTPTEAQLDVIKTSFEAALNVTKLDSDNFQASSVSTAKIADGAITGAKLNNDTVDDSTLERSSTVLRVKDGGVTKAKLTAAGQQVSSSSGSFSTTNDSATDVTNLSVSLTTSGRPVLLMLIPDGSGSNAGIQARAVSTLFGGNPVSAQFYFVRDSTQISIHFLKHDLGATSGASTTHGILVPPGVMYYIDVVSAGTYTYKVQAAAERTGGEYSAKVLNCKLIALEIR